MISFNFKTLKNAQQYMFIFCNKTYKKTQLAKLFYLEIKKKNLVLVLVLDVFLYIF